MPVPYYVEHVTHGSHDGAAITLRWNGVRLIVSLLRNPCPTSTENHFIESYGHAFLTQDTEKEQDITREIVDAIIEAGRTQLEEIAPSSIPEQSDLHTLLFPPEFSFRLVTIAGRPELLLEGSYRLQISSNPTLGYKSVLFIPTWQPPQPEFSSPKFQLITGGDFRTYHTNDIEVIEKLFGDGYITRVSVDGREMCAKVGRGWDGRAMQRELDCLEKITTHAAKSATQINIPKLLGVVQTPDDEEVIGILEELIPRPADHNMGTLAAIESISDTSEERRRAWFSQIRRTIDWLHGIGVVWGDAKPQNILIHAATDEAWIVDFGGGRTEGWVDECFENTVQGDEQAMRRISELLGISD